MVVLSRYPQQNGDCVKKLNANSSASEPKKSRHTLNLYAPALKLFITTDQLGGKAFGRGIATIQKNLGVCV